MSKVLRAVQTSQFLQSKDIDLQTRFALKLKMLFECHLGPLLINKCADTGPAHGNVLGREWPGALAARIDAFT